jgi:hypothetical protein
MKETKNIYEFISEFERRVSEVTEGVYQCSTLEMVEEDCIRTKLEVMKPGYFPDLVIYIVKDIHFDTVHFNIINGPTGEEIWLGQFTHDIDGFLGLLGNIISHRIAKETRRYKRYVESDERLMLRINNLLRK